MFVAANGQGDETVGYYPKGEVDEERTAMLLNAIDIEAH